MSAGDQVRSKIRTVETAISDGKTPHVLQAVVVTLKEIADALDEAVETHSSPGTGSTVGCTKPSSQREQARFAPAGVCRGSRPC